MRGRGKADRRQAAPEQNESLSTLRHSEVLSEEDAIVDVIFEVIQQVEEMAERPSWTGLLDSWNVLH
jgi:hypothetical protein